MFHKFFRQKTFLFNHLILSLNEKAKFVNSVIIETASLSINSEERVGMTCCIEDPPDYVCHVNSFTESRGNTTYQFIMGIEVPCPYV